jgi:hypothetical protein
LKGQPVPGAVAFGETDLSQYRVPPPLIRRQMFPSYARHIARTHTGPRKRADGTVVNYTVTRVKIVRVEHRVLAAQQFLPHGDPVPAGRPLPRPGDPGYRELGDLSPYHPTTFFPYYIGEFDPAGDLIDPNDPLLYWLVPVQPAPAGRDQKPYLDHMSRYATGNDKAFFFPWEVKE